MGKICLIFTGGTISMKIDDVNHSVIPAFSADEIMASLLHSDIYNDLETIEFSKIPSPSFTPSLMLEISKLVQSCINRDDVDGVVIVQGTDTLEETAFFLDIILDSKKPVIVTGSMKSSSELGFDGINNLVSSILVAKSKQAKDKGILVVMNDQINAASEVTKSNTLTLDTFKSLDYGPLGIVDNRQVIFHRSVSYPRNHVDTSSIVENVELLKSYAGMDSSLLLYLASLPSTKGIVVEALGRGNLPPDSLEGIKICIDKHIPVVICSRCPSGRVLDTYGYVGGGKDLTKMGCILAPYLNGQKARILLLLGLSKMNNILELKRLFDIQ
ncbi:MAG: asparaginase [Candidatus Izemoplasmatales bacterium]|nr:asparaginase [Candidatus Izemoplasmatales bacterium]